MKKTKSIVFMGLSMLFVSAFLFSCGISKPVTSIIPQAINNVNTVGLDELNLTRDDYEILNTVTAEAYITCEYGKSKIKMSDESGEFTLSYKLVNNLWIPDKYSGVMKLGYLANDTYNTNIGGLIAPDALSRRIAIYRVVNMVQQYGADGIIEPIVSTNVEEVQKDVVVYKTTVSGKIIKLKTNK